MREPDQSPPISFTLRALAHLLNYPDADLRAHLGELRQALHAESALTAGRLAELDRLIGWLGQPAGLETEAEYVETFDRGRGTALHLFEHVHGDSRERGPAMIDLTQSYEQAGLYLAPGELPDHLCVALEYASTQPAAQARAFLGEMAHILQALFGALLKRRSPWASALAAVLDLAGGHAPAVELPPRAEADESWRDEWEEPPAFDGCPAQDQTRPGQPQPIEIVRRRNPPSSSASSAPSGVRA